MISKGKHHGIPYRMGCYAQAGRGLRYHLPPRALWVWLCDGLAVYDALIVATWLALNVLYIQQRYALLSSASISMPSRSSASTISRHVLSHTLWVLLISYHYNAPALTLSSLI